jgi:acyl transferase domain-containing protein/thioesterase domain-containing protein/acyl carrier protein
VLESDIAVVGMAGRFAGARSIDEYWNHLRDGVESLTTFSEAELAAAGVGPAELADPNYVRVGAVLPDMEEFDARFFGFSPREASIMDPQHRHFLEVAWSALENAGHMPATFDGSIGIFGGSGHNAYLPYNLLTNPKLMQQVGFFLVRHTGNDKDFLTTRVSYLLNLRGPSVNVQTACSTSLVAIHMGVQSLLNGECDMAMAGGVTIELPHRHGYVYRENEILSPDGHCRAFDAASKGTVFGSGVGVVVLRRLAEAVAAGDHIHAVIKGSAVNNDGSQKVGYMAPSVDGQAQAIAEAMAIANVGAESIGYVAAHGTGTPVGDPIEVAALTQAYRQSTDKTGYCALGSVKANIGHTDSAAGVASFIAVAKAMQAGEIPPLLHFRSGNPACDFERTPFYLNAQRIAWQPPAGLPRRAGVSSLGVGGTNAHIVLEQAPPRAPSSPATRRWQVLVQSARSMKSLDAGSVALAEHLRAQPQTNLAYLADAAYTLQVGRQPMPLRRIVVADSTDAATQALLDTQHAATDTASDAPRSVVFMFAGGGAQHPNMGADLYASEPVYRAAVDECLSILRSRLNLDLKPLLYPAAGAEDSAAEQLQRPSLALPALLTTQIAQARLWQSWGIEPAAMIGHSMGEYTAAHLSGVFSLADALTLVELRGRLFETLPEGAMLSVPLPEAELLPLLTPDLAIGVINGPQLCVASGPVASIETLQRRLAEMEIDAARVRINVAAHSPMLEPILAKFGTFLRGIVMRAPQRPFISNLSGAIITAAEANSADYWVRHLRHTVRFADGLQQLLADETRVLLEVGPGRTLSSLARSHPARKPAQPVLASMRHADDATDDQAFMLGAFGRLWATGVEVDWSKLRTGETRLRIELPTYCFEHQRHWVEPGKTGVLAPEDRPLHKRKDLAQWFYQPVWQRTPVATAAAAPHSGTTPQRTLLLSDGSAFAERLAQHLRAGGDEVIVATAGRSWREEDPRRFTLDAKSTNDLERLFQAVLAVSPPPSRIVHLWNLGSHDLETTLQRGFYRLLQIAQVIGREDLSEPMALMVLTRNAQRVAGETEIDAAKATLLGPCKVLPREFPNVRCVSADIDTPAPGSPLEQRLLDGLAADLDAALHGTLAHDVTAWRAGERWVREHVEAPLPAVAAAQSKLRTQGAYLITGGLGGVGLALAEHLARRVQARLVLVGRQGLPERSHWPDHLARGDALARRIRQVMAIEALGSQVLVIAADVTNAAQMKAAVRHARARFGTLHGVLHTAGVLADGVIQLKDAAVAASVLAPKVQGTLALEAALADDAKAPPLDFLLLFSSISAFAGLAGQIDYAAANAFLDAYAQSRWARGDTRTIAVDWSQWQEVGMAAELASQLGLAADAFDGEGSIDIGHPLAQRLLLDTRDERVVEARLSRATHWLLEEHQVKGGEALIPGTGYLEIVREAFALRAAAAQAPGEAIELRNVTFLTPFVVRAGEERDLRVHLRGLNTPAASFSVVGRAAGAAHVNDAWTEHVRGQVARVAASPLEHDSVADVAARCRARTQEQQAAPEHLLFGPRWSNLRRIDFGDNEALLALELPLAFAPDLAEFPLHPALMDLATAGAQSLVPGFVDARDFYVPAQYGRLRIHGPLTALLTSHVRRRVDANDDAGAPDLARFDVTIRDAAGRVVVEVDDFTMIRVRDKALLAGMATAPAPANKPRATANNVLALGLRDGIGSAEGAEAIERVLAAQPGPQVVVSPQDLIALMARLRQSESPLASAAGSAEATAGYQAPSTALEKTIAQMWAEMLGHARVGANDNFFDLGGHSLLAVQVINKLKKKTGKALPLTALLEAPTVQSLAALIDPGDGRQDVAGSADGAAKPTPVVRSATLVPVRPASGKPPLFFVHDGLGETLLYRNLALKLVPGHPVYGIQPEVNARGEYAQTTIRDWAAAHLRTLRRAQPQGPYWIAGLCAGGVIAVEMARQLQESGEQTAYVGILDAADTQLPEVSNRIHDERLQRLKRLLAPDGGTPTPLSLLRALPALGLKAWRAARYELSTRWARAADARKVRRLRSQGAPQAQQDATEIGYLPLYEHAHREHQPGDARLQGLFALYRATHGDGTPADQPYLERYGEPLLGWGPRVAQPIEVADVPGGHASLLQEPNVQRLAEAMNAHLVRALEQQADLQARPASAETRAAARAAAPPPTMQTADIDG